MQIAHFLRSKMSLRALGPRGGAAAEAISLQARRLLRFGASAHRGVALGAWRNDIPTRHRAKATLSVHHEARPRKPPSKASASGQP